MKSLQLVACPLLLVYEAALQELQLGEKKCSNIWQLAQKMLVLFGSTYVCELTFSVMNVNKTRNRAQLTEEHLGAVLWISTTKVAPVFDAVAKKADQQHCSH